MRTFVVLGVLAGVAFWAARRTPPAELHLRVLRRLLYLVSGVFAALLVSAILQALVGEA